MNKFRGYYRKLVLGEKYTVKVEISNGFKLTTNNLLFIQVTEKGYNFLNTTTNKCIFNRLLYPSNKVIGFFYLSSKVDIILEK